MKVRLLVTLSGTRNGVPWPTAGNPMDLPDDEARQMIDNHQAIPVSRHAEAERAVAPDTDVETREAKPAAATERPLTTRTGPAPARKGASR